MSARSRTEWSSMTCRSRFAMQLVTIKFLESMVPSKEFWTRQKVGRLRPDLAAWLINPL